MHLFFISIGHNVFKKDVFANWLHAQYCWNNEFTLKIFSFVVVSQNTKCIVMMGKGVFPPKLWRQLYLFQNSKIHAPWIRVSDDALGYIDHVIKMHKFFLKIQICNNFVCCHLFHVKSNNKYWWAEDCLWIYDI